MKAQFEMMAAYNEWANRRLYDACAALSEEERRADLGAFFRSVHGTLNHLLVADRIWMRRFTGEGDAPAALDAILFEEFADLRLAREAEDTRISGWVGGLSDADIESAIRYTTISAPAPIKQRLAPALAHFFNHQTHHRGQLHALLTRLRGDAPSFDLILFQRSTGMGMAE